MSELSTETDVNLALVGLIFWDDNEICKLDPRTDGRGKIQMSEPSMSEVK